MKNDKLLHLMGAMLVTREVYDFSLSILEKVFISLIVVLLLSIAKEVYDVRKKNPTGFDSQDIMAAMFGSMLMIFIMQI